MPLEPSMTTQTTDLSYDDASQISSAGYAYDARGRQTGAPGKTFTWDGAGRLTSVSAGGSTAALTYNGLGNLRTRTVGSATTTYYHNYAFILPGIVAEKVDIPGTGADSARSQSYKRFYIYTPSGSLLYSIGAASGAVCFYHFDDVGSTLFLTNNQGAVSDAYAYDPYGQPAGHTGASDQPFTYVGRFGVRWEPVGALYDMRARYYDPATTRFLTRDPFWPRTTSIEELDPYVYAGNIPTLKTDPVGMSPRVTVWGTQYSIVDLWATDVNHHGLFFSFPDQTQSVAVDITGNPYQIINRQPSGAEIRQRHSTTLMDHLDWLRGNHSGVGCYNLGPDGIPLRIGVDEAQAALHLFNQLQQYATYGVAGGMTSCGYYIYCWETYDILTQFLAMYRWVFERVASAIERMNTTCGDWQDPAKRRYFRSQLNLMAFSQEEMRTAFRGLSRFGDIAAANWSQLMNTAFNQIANQLAGQSAGSTGGKK
ncbi:MAG: RHS repeat-associated core domain-containing protein [Chloroflexi bacterium]|nr:RHS repeat-associated core domain-containing protein [Chloroflexota bacterium]